MSLVVIPVTLHLIGLDQSVVCLVLAAEDGVAMVLHVDFDVLLKLKIVVRALVQVTRLANDHRRHLICHELLPSIQSGKGGKRDQP